MAYLGKTGRNAVWCAENAFRLRIGNDAGALFANCLRIARPGQDIKKFVSINGLEQWDCSAGMGVSCVFGTGEDSNHLAKLLLLLWRHTGEAEIFRLCPGA